MFAVKGGPDLKPVHDRDKPLNVIVIGVRGDDEVNDGDPPVT